MANAPLAASTSALQSGMEHTTFDISGLWIACMGIGGQLLRSDVADITGGARPATAAEHDILATAMNDWFVDHGLDQPVSLWAALPDAG